MPWTHRGAALDRCLRCLRVALSGRSFTVATLAQEMGVCERTARRYIRAIEDAGFPLMEVCRGRYRVLVDAQRRTA